MPAKICPVLGFQMLRHTALYSLQHVAPTSDQNNIDDALLDPLLYFVLDARAIHNQWFLINSSQKFSKQFAQKLPSAIAIKKPDIKQKFLSAHQNDALNA